MGSMRARVESKVAALVWPACAVPRLEPLLVMMNDKDNWDVFADNEDEELQQSGYADALKDVILFAIDCSSSMMTPRKHQTGKKRPVEGKGDEMEPSHLFGAFKAAVELMRRKAINEPDDMIGIVLFNIVDNEKGEEQMQQLKPHVSVFQKISQVNADRIQELLSILNDPGNESMSFQNRFRPWSRRIPLGDLFSACNRLLREQAPKTATKRVFLVTDEDDPHSGNAQLDRIAKQNLSSIPTIIEGFSRIIEQMVIREAPKRSQFSVNMTLGNGFVVGVKGYSLVMEQKKTTPKLFVDVDGELKELAGKTTYFIEGSLDDSIGGPVVYGMSLPSAQTDSSTLDPESNQELLASSNDQNPGELVGHTPVFYTKEDIAKFRTLGLQPGIKIMGFKDADTLAFEDNIKHSYFIYPSDALYQGSIRAFSALLKTLVSKNKIGIALALFRRNSSPYFYAMVPQEEILDEDGNQERPPGFHMIALPFADDIRAAPVEQTLKASPESVQAAKAWIKKVRIPKGYDPDMYRNPTLKLFYGQLEALALREEFNTEFSDDSMPQTELMLGRAGALVEKWKATISEDPHANTYVASTTGKKRKAETSIDELEIRDHYAKGTLGKVTVGPLKAFL
ncbi:ATP-dependent DNA helicase II subunit 1, partial [Serendipita sp. 401]